MNTHIVFVSINFMTSWPSTKSNIQKPATAKRIIFTTILCHFAKLQASKFINSAYIHVVRRVLQEVR